MNPESIALLNLQHKYQCSSHDLLLARIAARLDVIEMTIIEELPHGKEMKQRVAERNLESYLELAEHYLRDLTGFVPNGDDESHTSHSE
jgi:hypothetical protein